MSYITVPQYFETNQITKINNDMFIVEDSDGWFMIGSLYTCSSYWAKKNPNTSLSSFIEDSITGFPTQKPEKKNVYLCFFHRIHYVRPNYSCKYTTFTNLCYDDIKEVYLLMRKTFIYDILQIIWKLFFSVYITDKSSIQEHTIIAKKSGASNHNYLQCYFNLFPKCTYLFND